MKHTTYKITYEITGRIASGEVVGRHEYDTELQAREDLRVKTELWPNNLWSLHKVKRELLDQFPQKENVGKTMPEKCEICTKAASTAAWKAMLDILESKSTLSDKQMTAWKEYNESVSILRDKLSTLYDALVDTGNKNHLAAQTEEKQPYWIIKIIDNQWLSVLFSTEQLGFSYASSSNVNDAKRFYTLYDAEYASSRIPSNLKPVIVEKQQ